MRRIVLVLRESKDFTFEDVQLLRDRILEKWQDKDNLEIICIWDGVKKEHDLGILKLIPMTNDFPGTWSRMQLYSHEMEKYKPFLYIDLDTAIINNIEVLFDLVESKWRNDLIVLEDFYQKKKLATGLVWFPLNNQQTKMVWVSFKKTTGNRMDYFLRKVIKKCVYWQDIAPGIISFKPDKKILQEVPNNTLLVCFHGNPRIPKAEIDWVKKYREDKISNDIIVTVIIPYKDDRGWLNEAINSVPDNVQLIVSQGNGNWPSNFNKVLHKVKGKYVKYLHEDDMLTSNCIKDSIKIFKEQDVDFIHGKVEELIMKTNETHIYTPSVKIPDIGALIKKNTIHSASLMYKKEIFDKIGGFDETLETQEEYEFNLRCLKTGFRIGYCDSVLAVYRRHAKQKVRIVSKKDKIIEKQQVNKKYNG